jgi:hypothetical protein
MHKTKCNVCGIGDTNRGRPLACKAPATCNTKLGCSNPNLRANPRITG